MGWAEIELTPAAADDPLLADLPGRLTVLHWHGDTFDPPSGSIHLAASSRYRNQAFRIGARAWGIQFHLEIDNNAIAAFLDAFGQDTERAGTTPDAINRESPAALEALRPHRARVLTRFADLVATHAREELVDQ